MANYDVHIAGGTVVDGTRVPRYRGDIWIKDGRIAQVGGRPNGTADRVIDATGCVVAPGFIDLHTHYDAQIRWDPWCTISSWHGVTSVVLGNCGFGFAPCKPDFRDRSMLTMVRTEAIPYESMVQGMLPTWDWETIPEYLDSLEGAPKGVNVLQYMPTASLMTYVMGLDAAKSRPATKPEREEMQRLLNEGMDAGLCGFSIQRLGPNSTQADFDGSPMVTDTMIDDDIFALAEVLRSRDEGFIQLTQATQPDPNNPEDLEFKLRLAEVAQRPIIDNVVPVSQKNPRIHQERLEWLEKAQRSGLRIFGQGATVRTGFAFSLDNWNLYDSSPGWREATTGTVEEKMAKMRDPSVRERLRRETDEAATLFAQTQGAVGGPPRKLVVQHMATRPDLSDKYEGRSLGEIADGEGRHYIDVMLDLSLETDLTTEFLGEGPTFSADNMTGVYTESPYTIPGVSDGGAHTKFFTGGAWTTDFLSWMVRDTGKLTLEEAHYRMSALAAHAAGFKDRGVLREGSPADVVVYNLDELAIDPEWIGEAIYDLPGGEWRRVQRANGYRHILVNGEETFADGDCTGSTPGKLLRHGRG
ncbi:MAG: amidohydrolase family protein [Acidimicrobiia bacterium]|nr:amidohydrolase family protein [Acidimicrobiia bacterium]